MGAVNQRGLWVPGVGDGLLAGWQTMAKQAGVYVPVDSTAAAAEVLDAAQAAGMGATTSSPILFLVGSTVKKVAYVADGTKTSGKWNLAPMNEVDFDSQTYRNNWSSTLAPGQFSTMIDSGLKAAPYKRLVDIDANAWGYVSSGSVFLALRVQGETVRLARMGTGGTAESYSLQAKVEIAADTSPAIKLGVLGATGTGGGGTAQLVSDPRMNYLGVSAFPISTEA